MPIRSVKLAEAEARALRELSNRFPTSGMSRKVALNAVRSRCARLAHATGKNEIAVLCKASNQIDVLHPDEYFRDSHKGLWDF